MKVIVIGKVRGKERYRDEADLGEEKLPPGSASGPVTEAMNRIARQHCADFDPFSGTFPDSIEFEYQSEFP